MAFNRNWLKQQLAYYLKDDSVGIHLDTWIDLSAKRVSSLLECFEMEEVATNSLSVAVASGVDGGFAGGTNLVVIDGGDAFSADPAAAPKSYIPLPTRFKRLVVVQVQDNGLWRALRSVPKHEVSHYRSNGYAEVYHLEEGRIYPLPFQSGDYRAIYLREVEIPVGDNTDRVLTAFPYVFLNAALAEAYDWKQDEAMFARYEGKWLNEVEQIKVLYRSEHNGETPAMRAM